MNVNSILIQSLYDYTSPLKVTQHFVFAKSVISDVCCMDLWMSMHYFYGMCKNQSKPVER